MYLEGLAPNDYSKFLPGFILDRNNRAESIRTVFPTFFIGSRTPDYIKWEIINGLEQYNDTINNRIEGKKTRHFTVDMINDIRILFRRNNDDGADRVIGKKMRLYFTGNIEDDDAEIEKADSGWLQSPSPRYIFQRVLATTHLYNSLYAIGHKALIGILNGNLEVEPNYSDSDAGKDGQAKENTSKFTKGGVNNYRTLAVMSANFRPREEFQLIDHILVPAGWAANVDDPVDFFGKKFLDDFMDMVLYSRNMDDVHDRIIALGFSDTETAEILAESNNPEDALDKENDRRNGNAEGFDIVRTLSAMADILDEEEE